MEQKIIRRMLIATLAVAVWCNWSILSQKSIEDIRAIYIVRLMACGFTIGTFFTSLIMFLNSKKNK